MNGQEQQDDDASKGSTRFDASDGSERSLHRDIRLPLYFQVRDTVLEEIKSQGLNPGERLPTEAELEQRYGVSRATIRQALAELESEGRVTRIQGKGTFVAIPKIQHVPLLTSFSELLRSQGYEPSHRILESRRLDAPPPVAEDLGVAVGTPCRFLRRLLLANGRVVGVSETWLSPHAIRGHDELFESDQLAAGSLYELLQGPAVGLILHGAVETITAEIADDAIAALLKCATGDPVLTVKRVSTDLSDRPVESTRLVFASTRYEYRVQFYGTHPQSTPARRRAIRPTPAPKVEISHR